MTLATRSHFLLSLPPRLASNYGYHLSSKLQVAAKPHRVPKPSFRLTDANNAAASFCGGSGKRKAACAELNSPDEAAGQTRRKILSGSVGSLSDHLHCIDTGTIRWWGHHEIQYPALSQMARDYLAIQGSATPSERVLSSSGLIGTSRWNQLSPDMFEALQLLKGSYRSGHITAVSEAAVHASKAALFEVLVAKDELDGMSDAD